MKVPQRIVSTLTASMLLLAACGPASQATPATSAPAATTAPAATSAPAAASGAQPTAAARPPAVPVPTIAPAAGQPKPGGRVILGEFADAKTLNPVTVSDVPSDVVTSRIYAALLTVDAKTGDVQPGLADKFDFSADGKTLTFTLRDGLTVQRRFSIDRSMTSSSRSWPPCAARRPITKTASIRSSERRSISTVPPKTSRASKLTVRTFTVTLNTSFCPALTQIGGLSIIPKSVFGKYFDPKDASKNLDDAPENNAPPVASGAFKFKEWVPNDHVTLVRNDNFWQKANIDEWVHKVYPNQDALTAALKVGEVDMAEFDPKDVQDMQGVSGVQVFKYLNLGYTYIGWNQARGGKEFLQSKAVRQALAYGLNVDQVVSAILFGEGVKMIAHTPPVSWAYDTAGLNDYKYDPAKAEQLLQQDGWTKGSDGIYAKDGQKLEFSMITNSGNKIRETFIQVAAEQYKQIGVNVDPKTESFEALVDRLNTSKDPKYGDQGAHDFDSYVLGWSLGTDPDMYQVWHSTQTHPTESNYIQFKNPDLDKAIEDSRTHCSQPERKAAIKTANQILNEQQPYNFGFAQNKLLGRDQKAPGHQSGPVRPPGPGQAGNVVGAIEPGR